MAEKFTAFTPQDSVMLLIDHQQGTLNFCRNISRKTIVQNARALARIAKALEVPVVLTTSQEDHAQGPLIPDMQEILPEATRRGSSARAWPMPGTTPTTATPSLRRPVTARTSSRPA